MICKVGRLFPIIILLAIASGQAKAQQVIVGYLEQVTIGNKGFKIMAKIDTGADSSSINAVNPRYRMEGGQEWVRFTVRNKMGDEIIIDKPVVKKVRIKTKKRGWQKRSVIELDICLGPVLKTTHVNLTDRSHFKYQVLIGRKFLRPEFLVGSDTKFTNKPECK